MMHLIRPDEVLKVISTNEVEHVVILSIDEALQELLGDVHEVFQFFMNVGKLFPLLPFRR